MSKGCVRFVLISTFVFAALTSTWAFILRPGGEELPWEKGAILGLLGLGMVLCVQSLLKQRTEIRLVGDAVRGLPPEDGKRAAAIGELHPTTDAVLTAPFSGEPALAYSYVVTKMAVVATASGKRRETSVKAYEGNAMAPCEIRTPFGAVRMLEPPMFDVAGTTHRQPEAVVRAARYLGTATFLDIVSPGTIGEMRRKVEAEERESLAATDGFRYDGRISNPDAFLESPIDLRTWDLDETRFAPGETVNVLGKYDAVRGGFTAVATDVVDGVFLSRGGAVEIVGRKKAASSFLSGLALMLLAAQAIVAGPGLSVRVKERAAARAEEESIPIVRRLFLAVEQGNAGAVHRLLKKGVDPEARDESQRALSHVAPNETMLKLVLDAGAPVDARNRWQATPLTVAAGDGDLGKVKLLLARGADPNAQDETGGTPLVSTTDPAIRAALVAAGARDIHTTSSSPPPSAP